MHRLSPGIEGGHDASFFHRQISGEEEPGDLCLSLGIELRFAIDQSEAGLFQKSGGSRPAQKAVNGMVVSFSAVGKEDGDLVVRGLFEPSISRPSLVVKFSIWQQW
ncbi:MAG: hypothetical protein P8130_01020 [Deltaproteobacteria bacterium]